MANAPFPVGFDEEEKLPKTRQLLQNCWNNGKNNIIQRPGIEGLNDTGGVARGQFEWNGALYQVVSNRLIKFTDPTTGTFIEVGFIGGANPIEVDHSFNETVIVCREEFIYTLDEADVITDITAVPNMLVSVDVAQINGRFVYIPADGSPAFFSDVGDASSIQPDAFFDAESLPDKNNAVFNFKNTLYICGTDSIEPFRDTGADPNPFNRVPGARIDNGYIGGLLEYNETYMFIGREKNQDVGIYALTQGVATKLSNTGIDLLLSGYTLGELQAAVSGRYKWRGYDIATFTLSRDSFGFYGGNWHKLDTVFNGISKPWGAGYITEFELVYYTAFSSSVGRFSDINTDYGNPITKLVEGFVQQENDDEFTVQSLNVGMSQGFNTSDGSVALQISRDNVTYSQPFYRNLGDFANYADKLEWNYAGGLGTYDGFFGWRLITTEDIFFSSAGLRLDMA